MRLMPSPETKARILRDGGVGMVGFGAATLFGIFAWVQVEGVVQSTFGESLDLQDQFTFPTVEPGEPEPLTPVEAYLASEEREAMLRYNSTVYGQAVLAGIEMGILPEQTRDEIETGQAATSETDGMVRIMAGDPQQGIATVVIHQDHGSINMHTLAVPQVSVTPASDPSRAAAIQGFPYDRLRGSWACAVGIGAEATIASVATASEFSSVAAARFADVVCLGSLAMDLRELGVPAPDPNFDAVAPLLLEMG